MIQLRIFKFQNMEIKYFVFSIKSEILNLNWQKLKELEKWFRTKPILFQAKRPVKLRIPELSTQSHRTNFDIPTVVTYTSMRQSTMCIFLVNYRCYCSVIEKLYRSIIIFLNHRNFFLFFKLILSFEKISYTRKVLISRKL